MGKVCNLRHNGVHKQTFKVEFLRRDIVSHQSILARNRSIWNYTSYYLWCTREFTPRKSTSFLKFVFICFKLNQIKTRRSVIISPRPESLKIHIMWGLMCGNIIATIYSMTSTVFFEQFIFLILNGIIVEFLS